MKSLLSIVLTILLVSQVSALMAHAATDATESIQQSQSAAVTNQDILNMLGAGLAPELIITRIKSSDNNFDVSPAGLETLKVAGAPEAIVAAMKQARATSTKGESLATDQPEQPADKPLQIRVPAGTKLDIEAAYTVVSADVRPGELLSFRVLIPVVKEGVTVIEKDALVTAQVVEAKRAGHWGKAGRLSWTMKDVVAIDGTRIPIQIDQPGIATDGRAVVKGLSRGGEVATKTVVMGVLLAPLFPIAPLALMQGFKRGENAVLPEGKRLIVFVSKDVSVKRAAGPAPE